METKPKTADERDLLGTPLGRLFAAYERKTTLAHVEDGKLGAVVPLDITSTTWSDVPRGVVLKGLPPATAALSHNSSRFASVP